MPRVKTMLARATIHLTVGPPGTVVRVPAVEDDQSAYIRGLLATGKLVQVDPR